MTTDPRALVTLTGGTLTVTDTAGRVRAVTTDPHEAVTALLTALREAAIARAAQDRLTAGGTR